MNDPTTRTGHLHRTGPLGAAVALSTVTRAGGGTCTVTATPASMNSPPDTRDEPGVLVVDRTGDMSGADDPGATNVIDGSPFAERFCNPEAST